MKKRINFFLNYYTSQSFCSVGTFNSKNNGKVIGYIKKGVYIENSDIKSSKSFVFNSENFILQ